MDFSPIDPALLAEFGAWISEGSSMTASAARRMLHELERTERERQRLARDAESARANRTAMRETLFLELQDARKKIAELEGELQRVQALLDGAVA